MGTDCADTYFLVDHIHSAEAVEADLIETLFTRLVDGVEAGTRVLFFTAVWGQAGQTGGSQGLGPYAPSGPASIRLA